MSLVSEDVLLCHSVIYLFIYFPHKYMPETAYAYYSKYVNHKLVQSPTSYAAISSTVLVLGICFYVFWWDLRQARACITLVCLSSASYESPQPICSGANTVTRSIWTSSEFSGLLSLAFTTFTRTHASRVDVHAASLNKMEMGHFVGFHSL